MGRLPMMRSRTIPPPNAVTKVTTKTPTGSIFFSLAAKSPERAKETMPTESVKTRRLDCIGEIGAVRTRTGLSDEIRDSL